eukprot:3533914-Rhodomonas_salina.1
MAFPSPVLGSSVLYHVWQHHTLAQYHIPYHHTLAQYHIPYHHTLAQYRTSYSTMPDVSTAHITPQCCTMTGSTCYPMSVYHHTVSHTLKPDSTIPYVSIPPYCMSYPNP